MPHLPTVAGEALSKSASSKMTFIHLFMGMISPFIRHSFFESSNTVLRFSIQPGSAGPSDTQKGKWLSFNNVMTHRWVDIHWE